MNSTPSLKDLHRYITPNHATDWKEIGNLLGIHDKQLKIIECDYQSQGVECCCNAMLKKWLQVDTEASWKKLFEAIRSLIDKPPTISNAPKQGLLCIDICSYVLGCFT